ncbi:MAG: VOC family protein [Candidatus Micrarchaeota archaeon]
MDSVVHFEIPADDVKRAKKFYKDVFGWKLDDVPEMDYTMAYTVEVDDKFMPKRPGAINGGLKKRMKKGEGPVIVMGVDSIEDTLKKLKAAGGKAVGEKMTVGDMGFYQLCMDCEGNVIGIFQPTKM